MPAPFKGRWLLQQERHAAREGEGVAKACIAARTTHPKAPWLAQKGGPKNSSGHLRGLGRYMAAGLLRQRDGLAGRTTPPSCTMLAHTRLEMGWDRCVNPRAGLWTENRFPRGKKGGVFFGLEEVTTYMCLASWRVHQLPALQRGYGKLPRMPDGRRVRREATLRRDRVADGGGGFGGPAARLVLISKCTSCVRLSPSSTFIPGNRRRRE